ncbi:MAG: hypothetical protein L0Y56_12175 [Nitrospira sp.]|nr:hypothetical protein [Nitrospira sp.]
MPEITQAPPLTEVRIAIATPAHKKVQQYKRILRAAHKKKVSIGEAYAKLIDEALAANPLLNMVEKEGQ